MSETVDALVVRLVADDELTGATLSKPRAGTALAARKVTIDPVRSRGARAFRWRAHEEARTVDETLSAEETQRRLTSALDGDFRQALLHSPDADWQVLAGGGTPRVLRRPATRPEVRPEHDRSKRRILPDDEPVPFLVALGVMTSEGKVRASRQAKFRQVNRFLELVADVLPELPEGRLRVVDFGSGRSYLTFALHHLLTVVHGRDVDIVGLDLKEAVVDECEALARRLGARGLRFELGDIAGFAGVDGADLVVSLHACDTATDAALERAIRARAQVILAVPCCQHELLGQLDNAALRPLLRYGTLKERFAAEVTDAARAQLLALAGYDVQVVEFVELEHTPKNVLLRAVRLRGQRRSRDRVRLVREYRAYASELGIEPALERLLRDVLEDQG